MWTTWKTLEGGGWREMLTESLILSFPWSFTYICHHILGCPPGAQKKCCPVRGGWTQGLMLALLYLLCDLGQLDIKDFSCFRCKIGMACTLEDYSRIKSNVCNVPSTYLLLKIPWLFLMSVTTPKSSPSKCAWLDHIIFLVDLLVFLSNSTSDDLSKISI